MTATADWAARVGDTWAEEWRRTDRSFAALDPHLDAAILHVAPARGRFVDIGSGAGRTSLAVAAARPAAQVIGIDLSPRLVAAATQRGGRQANCSFRIGDAATAAGALAPVDLFFSRHGVMFFADPVAAFAALRRAAAPGASLVFSCFRDRARNAFAGELLDLIGETAPEPEGYAPGPFAFAWRDRVAAILDAAGWSAGSAVPVDYDYVAGEGPDAIEDAASFFTRIGPVAAALAAAEPERRAGFPDRLRRALGRWHKGGRVVMPASAWLWTARAGGEPG